jgi:ribonuclease HI
MAELKAVDLYTDGACSGNPGPGGWGAVLIFKGKRMELSGGEAMTTNNRMELTAVIQGLLKLKERCRVRIYTDSQYIVNAVNKGWVFGWQNNNWLKKDKKPALNRDLWETLLGLLAAHQSEFVWLKGHPGHAENERCDALAVAQAEKFAPQ